MPSLNSCTSSTRDAFRSIASLPPTTCWRPSKPTGGPCVKALQCVSSGLPPRSYQHSRLVGSTDRRLLGVWDVRASHEANNKQKL
ncbi:hypothetical protein FKM82_004284 [Ascaphus truei]